MKKEAVTYTLLLWLAMLLILFLIIISVMRRMTAGGAP
jgi:hypothetical protein